MGRPRKNAVPSDSDIKDLVKETEGDDTTISESSEQPKEKKPRAKKQPLKQDELQGFLANVFNMLSAGVKSAKRFTDSDFETEARGIRSLAEKYEIVATVIDLILPLVLVFGLFEKVTQVMEQRPPRAEKQANPAGMKRTPPPAPIVPLTVPFSGFDEGLTM